MLTVDFSFDEVANTVPYPPLFDEIRRNLGFVDLRGRPDLAGQIIEGSSSPALRALLTRLAVKESPLCTLGCDLGEREKPNNDEATRFIAGGYVQWVFSPPGYCDPDQYQTLGEMLAGELEPLSEGHVWQIALVMKFVDLNLDGGPGLVLSQWVWFDACAVSAVGARASRELLLENLQHAISALNFAKLTDRSDDDI